jgi:hypothetical protein
MWKSLVTVAMGLALGQQAAAMTCEEFRNEVRAGLNAEAKFEVVGLFDASQHQDRVLDFSLILQSDQPCDLNEPHGSFWLGRTVLLKTAHATYTAAFGDDLPQGWVGDSENGFLNDARIDTALNIEAYRDVMAAIMKELGFDSFESANGTFGTLLKSSGLTVPGSAVHQNALIGVVSLKGQLYQVTFKSFLTFLPQRG